MWSWASSMSGLLKKEGGRDSGWREQLGQQRQERIWWEREGGSSERRGEMRITSKAAAGSKTAAASGARCGVGTLSPGPVTPCSSRHPLPA